MKRVLFFRSELLPPSETFIAAQAAALRRYEPWFAGLKRIPSGLALDESRVISLTGSNSLRDKIARRTYLRTGFAPSFLQQVESIRPDLIHAHFATDACAALDLQQRLRVSLVVTLHGYDVTSSDAALRATPLGRIYLRRRHEMWERASAFICVSEWIGHNALRRGFPSEKLRVLPIGIDVESFHSPGLRPKDPLVLFAGRLVEKKGCVHLLRAMRMVEAQMPEAHLVIIGDGPMRAALESQARSSLRRCEFIGAASPELVRDWMRRASVVAVPSVVAANGDSEGLCLVVCEAQAMGLPVVAFRGPGIEVVDGETGLLVPQRDENALADALLALLQNEPLAARMGAAGRRRVERLFNLGRQTALLEAQYDEALARVPAKVAP